MKLIINTAAQELGISPRTLDKWAKEGLIKSTRSAGGWRLFDTEELQRVRKEIQAQAKRQGGR